MSDVSMFQDEAADLEAAGIDTSEMDFWRIFDLHGHLLNDNDLTQRCLADGTRIIHVDRRRAEILKMPLADARILKELQR